MTYTQYQVKDNAVFDLNLYPLLVQEISKIKTDTASVSNSYKTEILISYAKDHCLKLEWLKENPEFTGLVTSGALSSALRSRCSQLNVITPRLYFSLKTILKRRFISQVTYPAHQIFYGINCVVLKDAPLGRRMEQIRE